MKTRLPKADWVKETLDAESIDYTESNQGIYVDNLTTEEVAELFYSHGKEDQRIKSEAPETFHLPNKYAAIFREAIDFVSADTMIQFTSIKLKEEGELTEITVYPTQAIHFFRLCSHYGKLVKEQEKTDSIKS